NRFMVTWGSGVMENGWSVALSYSRRWADEGFVRGTFYDGNSLFGSVEKQINLNHSLSLTGFGSFTNNGRTAPAIQEMYDLAGSNYYNPLWGFQGGQVRNSSVARSINPVIILEHDWKIDDNSSLRTSVGTNNGSYRVSGLDWYEASDPRPDYYRNLPSYDPFRGEDSASYSFYSDQIRQNLMSGEAARQIQWDRLYEANFLNDTVFNGVTGKWAKYILSDRVIDNTRYFFNSVYSNIVNDHVTINGGLSYQYQRSDFYRVVNDLLGADFYVDLNQFGDLNNTGDSTLVQNDLNNPNRIVRVGDKYGYNYSSYISRTNAWAQGVFKYDRFDYFVAVNLGTTTFQRDGRVRNGIFINDSYGRSVKKGFTTQGIKGGATYKYNGRNYFLVNGSYQTRAPYFENAFVSPNTRNLLVNGLTVESIYSIEGGYQLKAPRFKAKVMGYYTQFKNGTDTRRFWHEEFNSFVNYTLTGIDKRHIGLEIGADANLGRGLSAIFVASLGEFIYNSRPLGTATQDNKDTILISGETIYMKNIRVASGPQQAITIGLNYRSPKFWFANLNLNYFSHIYTDVNPARRTLEALDLVDAGTEKWVDILSQERHDGQVTLDASFGYSWRVNNKFKNFKRPTYLNFNLGLNNILNNTDLIANAFEQLRFDYTDNNPMKFPPKYSYAFGTTFFLNIVLRMN
ncbi:MAG: TonB-dependent receptor, partial [Bacteroidota bacterium]